MLPVVKRVGRPSIAVLNARPRKHLSSWLFLSRQPMKLARKSLIADTACNIFRRFDVFDNRDWNDHRLMCGFRRHGEYGMRAVQEYKSGQLVISRPDRFPFRFGNVTSWPPTSSSSAL